MFHSHHKAPVTHVTETSEIHASVSPASVKNQIRGVGSRHKGIPSPRARMSRRREKGIEIVSRKTIGAATVAAAAMFAIATPSASAAPEVTPEQGSVFTEMAAMTDVPQAQTSAVADADAQKAKDKKAAKKNAKSNVDTGPSKWEGRTLKHPSGGNIAPEVTRWANLVSDVMAEHDVPDRYLEGILAQIQQESFGDPKAINNWDSNAAAGDPSKGLLQVIGSTYQAHAKNNFENRKYQDVPYTNIYAALNYVKSAYGMEKFKSWNGGANHGY